MREIKFRVWNKISDEMQYQGEDGFINRAYMGDNGYFQTTANIKKLSLLPECELIQYTGLKDIDDVEIYVGDILQFENGDSVIVEIEEWMEVFVTPIGEVKCEDQWRDLYRIERAKVVGNIHQHVSY